MSNTETVQAYYTSQVRREWRRLVRDPYHQLEFQTTLHFLEKYLPPGGLLLDAGGGPGRYTIELARRGYELILLDLTPANLDFARRRIRRARLGNQVREVVEGSIVDLSRFATGTFAAVLCLGGPLSHVLDSCERKRALAEMARVARPGGLVFVSVMSRLSLLKLEMTSFAEELEMPHFAPLRSTGDYSGDSGFTACHFFLPEELGAAIQAEGLELLEMAGLERLASNHPKELNRLAKHPARWQIWLDTHFQTCSHPAVIGLSEHMLAVGRKAGQG